MGDLQFTSIEFRKFGGGITDDWIDCEDTQCKRMENLLLDDQEKPFTRPGSVLLDSSNPTPGGLKQRTGLLYNYFDDTDLFCFTGRSLFYYRSAWTELTGPTGNKAIPSGDSNSRYNASEWKRHLLVSNNSGASVVVAYPSGSSYALRAAGLPLLSEPDNYAYADSLASAIALANNIRTQILAHVVYVTADLYHLAADTSTYSTLNAVPLATDFDSLLTLTKALKAAFKSHVGDVSSSSGQFHGYTTGTLKTSQIYYFNSNLLLAVPPPETLADCVTILNDIKPKWNAHDTQDVGISPQGNMSYHGGLAGTSGGSFQVTSALVDELTTGYTPANSITKLATDAQYLREVLYTHITDASIHAGAYTPDVQNIFLGASFIGAAATNKTELITYVNNLVRGYSLHVNKVYSGASPTSTQIHNGVAVPAGHKLSLDGATPYDVTPVDSFAPALLRDDATLADVADRLDEIWNQAQTHLAVTTGIHTSAPANSGISHETFAVGTYIYYLHYIYTYTINDITFEVRGPVTQKQVLYVVSPNQQSIQIGNIPVLVNSIDDNYPTDDVKIKIYRTISGETTGYLVDTIDNGTTSYSDTKSDAEIQVGSVPESVYTTGGTVDFYPPQVSRFVHVVGDIAYYGNVTEGNFRVIQSIPGTPESISPDFYVDLPEEVLGLSSFKGVPIAFTHLNVYRLEGQFDQVGRGAIRAVAISDKGGCICPYTQVQTSEGVYFWGKDGIYITDGYSVKNVTVELRQTYLNLTATPEQRLAVYGAYDPRGGRIWWGRAADGDEADGFQVLDMNWGVLGDKAITTASNGQYFKPTSACFFRNQLIRGDARGYVFKHDLQYATDPKVDEAATPSEWNQATIIYDYISRTLDWGTVAYRKWSGKLTLKAKNYGNLSMQPRAIDDIGRNTRDFTPIRRSAECFWGNPAAVWGGTTYQWGLADTGYFDEKRRPPAKSMRFSDRQIQLTNAYAVVTNSDIRGTVSAVGSNVQLGTNWNQDLVDYYIYFNSDGYVTGYKIVSVSGDTLTLETDVATEGDLISWQIKGYPKGDRLSLISFQIMAAPMGDTQHDAQGESGDLSSNSSNASTG